MCVCRHLKLQLGSSTENLISRDVSYVTSGNWSTKVNVGWLVSIVKVFFTTTHLPCQSSTFILKVCWPLPSQLLGRQLPVPSDLGLQSWYVDRRAPVVSLRTSIMHPLLFTGIPSGSATHLSQGLTRDTSTKPSFTFNGSSMTTV